MSHPLPDRSPAALAAVSAALAAQCADCGHGLAAHAPDGCRVCQLQRRPPGDAPGSLCAGFRSVDPWTDPAPPVGVWGGSTRPLVTDPAAWGAGNAFLVGVEDSDRLPCSTRYQAPVGEVLCGHRADQHADDGDDETGLGACGVDGCGCTAWTYDLPSDDVDAAADTVAGAMATAIGSATDDADTTRRVLEALRSNRAAVEVVLGAADRVDAEVLDPVGDAIRAVLEPYVGATWTADTVAAAAIALVTALEQHADDVADYLGVRAGWVAGAELNADRVRALARAIAGATDRYNGEATAVLSALLRDGWRLESTRSGVQTG